MGSEAGTTPKKDMGTKVNIVTCTAWEHLTAWHKGILNILGDSPLANRLVQGDIIVALKGAIVKHNGRKYAPQEGKQPIL